MSVVTIDPSPILQDLDVAPNDTEQNPDTLSPRDHQARNHLATQLIAKLCHDFISPAGAIISGLDLLSDPSAQDMKEEANALIATSAKRMVSMVHFARIAYGASTSAESFVASNIKSVLDELFTSYKAQLDFQIDPSLVLQKPAARALLNLALIAAQALPLGGIATITGEKDEKNYHFTATGVGRRARLKPEVIEGLSGASSTEGLMGQWIQPYWLFCIVGEFGGAIDFHSEDESVKISLSLPFS